MPEHEDRTGDPDQGTGEAEGQGRMYDGPQDRPEGDAESEGGETEGMAEPGDEGTDPPAS